MMPPPLIAVTEGALPDESSKLRHLLQSQQNASIHCVTPSVSIRSDRSSIGHDQYPINQQPANHKRHNTTANHNHLFTRNDPSLINSLESPATSLRAMYALQYTGSLTAGGGAVSSGRVKTPVGRPVVTESGQQLPSQWPLGGYAPMDLSTSADGGAVIGPQYDAKYYQTTLAYV